MATGNPGEKRPGITNNAPVRVNRSAGPVYGCEFCRKNILGEPYQPPTAANHNFCDEEHYELWHARQ